MRAMSTVAAIAQPAQMARNVVRILTVKVDSAEMDVAFRIVAATIAHRMARRQMWIAAVLIVQRAIPVWPVLRTEIANPSTALANDAPIAIPPIMEAVLPKIPFA